VVTETLKGEIKEKQLPIVINYGLDPLIRGTIMPDNKNVGYGKPDPAYPKDRIDIVDTGDMDMTVLAEAQKDNLWFLRHLGGENGREAGKGPWGIVDPQDVAPLKLKDYFKALLSKDPDKLVDGLLADPDETVVLRTLRYLASLHDPKDAQRIAKLLSSKSEKVQSAAAEALSQVADCSQVPTFREMLKSQNTSVREAGCLFLSRFGDTESIAAIDKAIPGMNPTERYHVFDNLSRMESRDAIPVLLDRLDPEPGWSPHPSMRRVAPNYEAAAALDKLTGIAFPLDKQKAHQQWDKLKDFPDEVLIRKSLLEDVEALSSDPMARSTAYEQLSKLTNRHFGSQPPTDHPQDVAAREKSQSLWSAWAKENITKTRVDWIYAGFADSGIMLPRPLDANGVDMLIDAIDSSEYHGDLKQATSKPSKKASYDRMKAQFHQYNANWLLEHATGHKVGISPYFYDLQALHQDFLSKRWAQWWKENRDKVKLLPLPEEKPMTDEMISKVPSLRAADSYLDAPK
jgi:hypothetical protein